MADLTITAASVVKSTGARIENGILGATVTAGEVVYKDTTDSNKFKLCDVDDATALIRTPYGIALNGGADGQPVQVQTGGLLTIGATVVVGTVYCGSDTPGGIMPVADLTSGDYVATLGIATTAAILDIQIHNSAVATP